MNTSQYKFVHIGNSIIRKEMFLEIVNDGIKPTGGFWASPNNKATGSISDWTDFILENRNEKFLRFNHTNGCFFNLKPDTKLIFLTTDKEYEQVKKNGVKITSLIMN